MPAQELLIYDPIDSYFGISASYVVRWLRALPEATDELVVRLNCPGGDVFEGIAIYNALHRHKARVVIEVDGVAASAASVIAMAGDEIRMAAGSMFMVHEAWGFTQGPAEDHEKNAELLRKINEDLVSLYAARTGQVEKKLRSMMAEETWLNTTEAKELGFADIVHSAKAPKAPESDSKIAASLYGRYKHTPSNLKKREPQQAPHTVTPEPPNAKRRPAAYASPLGQLAHTSTARLGDR